MSNLDGYDDAILGYSQGRVVYSYNRIIKILMADMSLEDAKEYYEFNIVRSLPYIEKSVRPLIIR